MADEYTPTSWVDGVPPYIDAEHLNKIEAELVRLGTQLAAIKAAYLGKSAISNVQVNDQNKVPSSALVYGMNEDISVLNSNLNGTKFFHSFSEIGNYDTLAEYLEAMPNNSILITDKTVDSESFGLPHSGTNTFLSVFVRKINNIRIDCECVSFSQQILKEKYVAFTGSSQSYVCDWKKVVINTDYTVYNIACSYGPSINLFKFGNDAIKAIKVQGYLNQQLLSTQKYTLATNDNLKSKVNWYKNVLIGTSGKDTIGYLEISPNGDLNLKPAVNLASGTGIHFMEYYV